MSIDIQGALSDLDNACLDVKTGFAEQAAIINRLSLERDSLSAANIQLQTQLDTANAMIAALKKQLDPPPAPVVKTVKDYGAKLDGVTDDTVAIQKAIDAGDGRIPDGGKALINTLRVPTSDSFYGLLVGPGKRLEMGKDAALIVKPNSAPRNCCVRVEGGTLIGGQILGDRLRHTYAGTTTHEWGYGFQARGDGCTVADLRVEGCTGDGYGVSGTNHKFTRVVSVGNRRQGASGFTGANWLFDECVFADTGLWQGQAGTKPMAGFDIEPDRGLADNITFQGCRFSGNDGGGLVGWTRNDGVTPTPGVTNVKVIECRFSDSANGMHFKSVSGIPMTVTVQGSDIKRGSGVGIKVDDNAVVTVEGNTFSTPNDRTDFTLTGSDSRTRYDTQLLTGGKANVGTNRYV